MTANRQPSAVAEEEAEYASGLDLLIDLNTQTQAQALELQLDQSFTPAQRRTFAAVVQQCMLASKSLHYVRTQLEIKAKAAEGANDASVESDADGAGEPDGRDGDGEGAGGDNDVRA